MCCWIHAAIVAWSSPARPAIHADGRRCSLQWLRLSLKRVLKRVSECGTLVDSNAADREQWNDERQHRQHAGDECAERNPTRLSHQPFMDWVADDGENCGPGDHAGERTQDRQTQIDDNARGAEKDRPRQRALCVRRSVSRFRDPGFHVLCLLDLRFDRLHRLLELRDAPSQARRRVTSCLLGPAAVTPRPGARRPRASGA